MEQIYRYAECSIVWNDTKEQENVTISLDGSDNDNIFFVCRNMEEFNDLTSDCNGEDFSIVDFGFIN